MKKLFIAIVVIIATCLVMQTIAPKADKPALNANHEEMQHTNTVSEKTVVVKNLNVDTDLTTSPDTTAENTIDPDTSHQSDTVRILSLDLFKPVHGAEYTRSSSGEYRLRLPSAEWDCGLRIDSTTCGERLDFSNARELALDIENLSKDRQMRLTLHLSAGARKAESSDHATANFTKNRSINTGIGLAPGERGTLRLFLPHANIYQSPDGCASPVALDTSNVSLIELKIQWPYEDEFRYLADVKLSNFRLQGMPDLKRSACLASFKPFIDKFGQFKHADWPEKLHSYEELPGDLTKELAELKPAPSEWDEFGGWKNGPRLEATDNFRTARYGGKWYLVTPTGSLFFSLGIDCTRAQIDAPDGRRHPDWYDMVIPPDGSLPFSHWALQHKFGKADYIEDYERFVARRLDSWGQNTIGNWSSKSLMKSARKPYVVSLFEFDRSLPRLEGCKFYDCFDPSFASKISTLVASKLGASGDLAYTATDRYCIGYFIDNELGFSRNPFGAMLKMPFEKCFSKREFLSGLYRKYQTIENLNKAWKTNYAIWDDLKSITEPIKSGEFTKDKTDFEKRWYAEYFKACSNAIKHYAPGRLYLGCRFVGFRQSAALWKAAAEHCDIITVNAYSNSLFNLPSGLPDSVPYLVGEFHFGCLDRGMFKAGLCPVPDQSERARSYTRFVEGLLCHPLVVGAHYFQYRDQPLVGRGDGEAYQIGFVDGVDRPYKELCAAARVIGSQMYELRARLGTRCE